MRMNRWILTLVIILAGVLTYAGISATDAEEAKPAKDAKMAKAAKDAVALSWVKYDKGLELAAKENKPIMVDFYTNWCKFCKKMDNETFTDGTVARYLDENFVLVKVNAESNETVITSNGNLSERQLSQSFGVRGYPAYWFLKSNGEKINNVPGYVPPDKFITILRYFGEGHYETTTWKDYLDSQNSN